MRRFLLGLLLCCAGQVWAQTVNIGQTAVFTDPDCCNANLLLAQHTPVTQAGTLVSLSFYASAAGGQLRLGVYDATGTGGGPGKLIAETAAFTPAGGWNTRAVQVQASVPVGAVWLAYLPSSDTLAFPKRSIGNGSRLYTRTFGPLPATFGAASSSPSQWSFYATLSTTPTVPVSAAPSAPSIQLAKFGLMEFAWDVVVNPALAGYRLYAGVGSSGCPGGSFVAIPAATPHGFVQHLAWGVPQSAQVTAVNTSGQQSLCSNIATGQPK